MEGTHLGRPVECHTAIAGCPDCPAISSPIRHCNCRYETVTAQAEALKRPYHELGKLLNCSSNNIAILQSATAAWMQVCTSRADCTDHSNMWPERSTQDV